MLNRSRLVYLVPVLIGLFLAVGAMTVFTACGPTVHGTWMNCHNAQTAAAACGAALTAVFVMAAFFGKSTAGTVCNVIAIVLSIITYLVPGILVSTCKLEIMRCNSVLKPFVRIMAVLEILFALWNVLRAVMKYNSES